MMKNVKSSFILAVLSLLQYGCEPTVKNEAIHYAKMHYIKKKNVV